MAATDHADLGELAASLLSEDHRALFAGLLQQALQQLIEVELSATIGAGPHRA